MNKLIAIGAASFAAGVAVGAGILYLVNRKKEKPVEPVETSEIPEVKDYVKELANSPSAETLYNEALDALKEYSANRKTDYSEDEVEPSEEDLLQENLDIEEDQKAFKEEHFGRIELMSTEDWDKFVYGGGYGSDVEYSGDDLYYFVDEDMLTDEFGGALEPVEKYVGEFLDIDFMTYRYEQDHLHVVNHPMETVFDVHRIAGKTRDEFFEEDQ